MCDAEAVAATCCDQPGTSAALAAAKDTSQPAQISGTTDAAGAAADVSGRAVATRADAASMPAVAAKVAPLQ